MIISRWLCTSDAAALAASRVASTARALVRPLPRAHEIEGHLVRAPPGRVATPPTTTGSVHAPLATQHHHRPLATSPMTSPATGGQAGRLPQGAGHLETAGGRTGGAGGLREGGSEGRAKRLCVVHRRSCRSEGAPGRCVQARFPVSTFHSAPRPRFSFSVWVWPRLTLPTPRHTSIWKVWPSARSRGQWRGAREGRGRGTVGAARRSCTVARVASRWSPAAAAGC